MAGFGVKLRMQDLKALDRLETVKQRMRGPQQPLHDCGVQSIRSSQRTFSAEGRPNKWPALAKSTLRHKRKTGHTKMLVDSSILKNSIDFVVSGNTMTTGTSVPYARIHQLGGEIHQAARRQTLAFSKGRFYSRDKASARKRKTVDVRFASIGARVIRIPAREFLLFQPEDIKIFNKIFRNWILKR